MPSKNPAEFNSLLSLVQNAPLEVYLIDADFRLLQVSAGAEKVFSGIDPLLNRDFAEVLRIVWPEPFASDALARFRHTLATGEPYHSPDTTEQRGNVAVVESYDWHIARVTMPDGRFGVVCYFYETTDRVHAEQDARFRAELGERCRTATDGQTLLRDVVQAIGVYLRAHRCFVNQVFEDDDRWTIVDDYCASGGTLTGDYRLSDYDAQARASLRNGLVEVITDAKTDPRSAARFHAGYDALGIRADVVVPLLRDGRWVASMAVTSEQPRQWQPREIALLETAAELIWNTVEKLRLDASLRQQDTLIRNVNDNTSELIFMKDLAGRLTYANAATRAVIGATSLSPGTLDVDMFSVPDEHVAIAENDRHVMTSGRVIEAEEVFTSPDGQRRTYLSTKSPLRDASGTIVGVIGVSRDITDRLAAEDALRDNDRRKDEFLAMLAHELRNPLASITYATQVLTAAGPTDATQQRACEIIGRQAQHLAKLVDDLLDVSRITQGKITLQREPLDITTIVDRAVEANRALADARRQQLTITLPSAPVQVEGDLTRLVQVASNLLNNAVKYTHEGGHIAIDATADGTHALLRVRDDGMGIAADLLPHVFDLFTQADRLPDRSQGGLGIGLTLVRLLVEMHSGRVEVRSEGPDLGSEFVVRLPLAGQQAAATTDRRISDSLKSRTGTPTPLRVLIVEDNLDSAEMLGFLLMLDGHETCLTADGEAGVDAARKFQPHVILCDLGLPRMNGYEVARQLRAQPEFAGIRLIALSGYGQEDDRRRAQEAGFDYHLIKPVEPTTLSALIDSIHRDRPPL